MRRTVINGVSAEIAETFAQRAVGLIGRRNLPPGTGMLITRCNCVHTFFMRFPIDVTFLDRHGKVIRLVRNVRPWRLFVWGGWRAVQALETPASAVRPA